ncbi:MAG TPA: serine/threonine-protein kinase [Haliangiales bacterium]|nr:serine/threonine-protein kinase [Haliangiales bacterium]
MLHAQVGNYRILEEIGRGGMGVVYRGEHVLLGQTVAVKLLHPECSVRADIVNRFFNEARAAALVKHPSIVGILDFGYHGQQAYLVMEHLDGETIAERLHRHGPLPEARVVAYARQVALALAAAHEKGIIHRDLKPENAFVVADAEAPGGERVKVLDFGVAKLTADAAPVQKTRTGAVIGSPAYMAPEQCRGSSQVDARADVYALGCMMFEMACGELPFAGEGGGEVIAKHIYEPPPSPRARVPSLSVELERVVLRCMAKAPGDRYASAADLARALELWAPPPPPAARASAADTARFRRRAVSSTTLGGSAAEARPPGRGRRKVLAIVAAGAAIGALGAAGLFVWRARPTSEPPAPPRVVVPAAAAVPTSDARPAILPPDAPPPPRRTVRLEIVTTPDGAAVYRAVDGVRLGTTPFSREFERTDGQAEFLIRKPGWKDQRITLPTDHDGLTGIRLTPER